MMFFNPQPKKKAIRLRGRAYSEFRKQVFMRDHGRCQLCGAYASLHNQYGYWDMNCGDVRHIKSRGAGGGDTMDNVEWCCHKCHMDLDHSPQWSKKV